VSTIFGATAASPRGVVGVGGGIKGVLERLLALRCPEDATVATEQQCAEQMHFSIVYDNRLANYLHAEYTVSEQRHEMDESCSKREHVAA